MIADFQHHGGALDTARRLFPQAPQPWLDLSTGINPSSYPFRPPPAELWARLPDAELLLACEEAAARRYRVPPGLDTVAVPGTQSLIARLPALLGGAAGADVRVATPTYGEFASVFRLAGARVRPVAGAADPALAGLAGADVAVIVNPNNPDGRLREPGELLRLAARVGTLIVDEAFADALAPDASVVPRMPVARVIVLRSFGKIYGLAGLRLGFAVAPLDRGAALRQMMGPWPVGGPALAVGAQALADEAWLAAARRRLQEDGARLGRMLRRAGASEAGAAPLFQLVAHPAAGALFRFLAERGILVRPFAAEPAWLRFGLPGNEEDWRRLAEALGAFR